MTIERYLSDLGRRLPLIRRRRFLAEAEAHLRDSTARHRAAGLDPERAEAEALVGFGSIDVVARRLAAGGAVVETRVASLLALTAAALFVFPLYVVPENTLPPASWESKPADILILQVASVSLWLVAVGLAALAALLAWTRWPRLAASAMSAVSVAMTAAVLISVALVVRWSSEASVTLDWPLLAAPLAACSLAVCVLAHVWASRRCELLSTG